MNAPTDSSALSVGDRGLADADLARKLHLRQPHRFPQPANP
jgi:hypothetical protein